jgi:hypothetical protein
MNSRGTERIRHDFSLLTADDLFLFNEGTHFRLYEKMGAQAAERKGVPGTCFAVWAPDAAAVYVMGDFNGWDKAEPICCHRRPYSLNLTLPPLSAVFFRNESAAEPGLGPGRFPADRVKADEEET